RAGADGGGHRHRPPAAELLGIGDRSVRHRLLVVAAIGGQLVANGIKRFAQGSHIAMAEDCPDAGDERLAVLVQLRRDIARRGLGGGQSDRFHAALPVLALARSHTSQRARYFPAIAATASRSSISPASQCRAGSPKMVRPTANPFTRS